MADDEKFIHKKTLLTLSLTIPKRKDRFNDLLVPRAAAKIADQPLANLALGGVGGALQDRFQLGLGLIEATVMIEDDGFSE